MPMKPTKRKITVEILSPVARAITRDMRMLHINRDSYLSALFSNEIGHLEKEIDFETPIDARKRIKDRFNTFRKRRSRDGSASTKPMTFAIDREVVLKMDRALKDKKISRISFINRVLFFLVAKKEHLAKLDIGIQASDFIDVKPLSAAASSLLDPFFYIRNQNGGEFYGIVFPDRESVKDGWNFFGINCAINPEIWMELNKPIDDSPLVSLGYVAGESR